MFAHTSYGAIAANQISNQSISGCQVFTQICMWMYRQTDGRTNVGRDSSTTKEAPLPNQQGIKKK